MPSTKASPLLLATFALGACSTPGQLVLGIGTDLPARGQLDHVTLEVTRHGDSTPLVPFSWKLTDVPAGDFRLPGSFNLYADEGSEPSFDVVVRGFLGDAKQVERRASLAINKDEELFVRLGLVAKCEQIGCPASLTCIEGSCKAQRIDVRVLPKFRPELVDHSDCASGTTFIDSSTHEALPSGTSCDNGFVCSEGTCLVDPATLSGVDPVPLVGGSADLFNSNGDPGLFPVGPIDTARFRATASLLADGRVLVFGGFPKANTDGKADNGPAAVAGALVYEPENAAFRRLPDPSLTFGGHTATVLMDGKVLLVGATAPLKPAALLYDPTTDVFTLLAPPGSARYFHTATRLLDGRVLIVGGATQNAAPYTAVKTAEIYDPATQTFKTTTVDPVHPRVFNSATLLGDGRVLVAGGLINESGAATDSVEAYTPATTPATDSFAEVNPLGGPRSLHTATLLSDGSVLIVGGQAQAGGPALSSTQRYLADGAQPDTQPGDALLGFLAPLSIVLGVDRVLYIAGASQLSSSAIFAAGGAFMYENGSFKQLADPAVVRIEAFAAVLADGDVLIGGGTDGHLTVVDGGTEKADASDGSMPLDMSIPQCEPVGSSTDPLCTGATPRCVLSASPMYGPHAIVSGTPQCMAAGTLSLGAGCGKPDGGVQPECMQGSLCLPDTLNLFGDPTCQQLCRVDTDCSDKTLGTCAQIFTDGSGTAISSIGVCMRSCGLQTAGTDCMAETYACRFERHQAMSGASITVSGVCEQQGMLPTGSTCSRAASDTECDSQSECVAGECRFLCTDDTTCAQGGFSAPCVPIDSSTASTVGYCTGVTGAGPAT